jgi:hypothetical protein
VFIANKQRCIVYTASKQKYNPKGTYYTVRKYRVYIANKQRCIVYTASKQRYSVYTANKQKYSSKGTQTEGTGCS